MRKFLDVRHLEIGCACQQLPQHVRKNSPVLVVIDFYWCIDPKDDWDLFRLSGCSMDDEFYILLWSYSIFQSDYIERLRAIESQRCCVSSFLKLTWQNAHAHEIAAVNSFEA